MLCLRIQKVEDIFEQGNDHKELYLQLKPSVHSLFSKSLKSSFVPSSNAIEWVEDFVFKVPVGPSFKVDISIKEKHTLVDTTIAHATLELPGIETTGTVVEKDGVLDMKREHSSGTRSLPRLHYKAALVNQPLPPNYLESKEDAFHPTNPRVILTTGKVYYPGDLLQGLVVIDASQLASTSQGRITFTTSSRGTTFDVVRHTNIWGLESTRNVDYKDFLAARYVSDYFSLFEEGCKLSEIVKQGGIDRRNYIVPFEFVIPQETPITVADFASRKPYFSEKVGRKSGEEMLDIIVKWDKLPIAHTFLRVDLMQEDKKTQTISQPLEIHQPTSVWESQTETLRKFTENYLETVQDKIYPSSASEHSDFITAEIILPDQVYIGEAFPVKVKINSRLSKKLCNIEVRVATAAHFSAKLVGIRKHFGSDEEVENGENTKVIDMSTVFRSAINGLEVHEGETKESELQVTLGDDCFPTLSPLMYPLVSSWAWVEVSIQKGASEDDTFSSGHKYYVVTQPLVVIPKRQFSKLSSPPSSATPATPAPSNESVLVGVKVKPPYTDEHNDVPFAVPTSNGEAYVSVGKVN